MKNKVGYIILLTIFSTISACLLIHTRTDAHKMEQLYVQLAETQAALIEAQAEKISFYEEPADMLPMFRDGEE